MSQDPEVRWLRVGLNLVDDVAHAEVGVCLIDRGGEGVFGKGGVGDAGPDFEVG